MMNAENLEARLTALLEATQIVGSSLDLDIVLETIVQQAAAISATPTVRLFLLEEDTKLLRCRVGVGIPKEVESDLVLAVGESFSGQVAATGEPLAVTDCRGDPRLRYAEHVSKWGLISYLGLPVKVGDRVMGVLVFNTGAPRGYTPAEIAYLSSFASDAAIVIENARLHAAAIRRGVELEALLRSTRSVMSELGLQDRVQRIVADAARIAGVPHVSVMLVDKAAQVLRVAAQVGNPVPPGFGIPLGTDLSGVVAQTGEPVFSPDSPNDPRNLLAERDREVGLITYLGLPITGRKEILGVLTFETAAPRRYSQDELSYLTAFADNVAIAIENARLHEAVQRHAADLETRVAERTAALQEALRAKAEFLAKMSHELRTPLNFVLGFAELLRQGTGGALNPKQAHYVDRIVSAGKHLLDLVGDLLDLSLVEAGRKGLQLETIPVGPLVREVLDLVGIQATQKRVELRQTVEPDLSIVAERRKLVQILSNLVANAVKFTPEGGAVTITARRILDPENGREDPTRQLLELAVADTGTGLLLQDLERIFRGFEQVDVSLTRGHGGAGIGLALVRRLVELHGGKVWAESAGLGQGARFVVHLPFLEAPSPKRVLVVENQDTLLKSLCVSMLDAGYAVKGAPSGAGALAAIGDRQPDLVVLDVGLPNAEGWEILRRLRSEQRTRGLPVLVLTGGGQGEADRAMSCGASEFLTKPVSTRTLIGLVRELLTGGTPHPGHLAPEPDE